MNKTKIKVKDQFEAENIAIALMREVSDPNISLFKRIEHIEIEGDILLPNMDLLYENPKDGKVYRVIGTVNAD